VRGYFSDCGRGGAFVGVGLVRDVSGGDLFARRAEDSVCLLLLAGQVEFSFDAPAVYRPVG